MELLIFNILFYTILKAILFKKLWVTIFRQILYPLLLDLSNM